MEFYKYLKKCREYNHITQEELVSALYSHDQDVFESLDAVTLSRWERHSTTPNTLKQLSIIKYFQLHTHKALPCWNEYSSQEVEDLICTVGIINVLGKSKQLILNFPSAVMKVDELKVYPIQNSQKAHALFELNMDLHHATNHLFSQLSIKQFEAWSKHPSNLFLACEYKEGFVGLFFSVRLKQDIFEKLMHFEMKKSEIREEDFAAPDEVGSDFLLSFYAINHKVATMLFVRHYAYLIANQKNIMEIGVTTTLDEVKKTVHNMNLNFYQSKVLEEKVTLDAYRQKLNKVLATEYVVKMLFSE